jgi:signal transduction histidine kinase/CheY-like chemotaxis protein
MPTTVLIVDDHPSFRSVARMLLEMEGYDVVGEAPDGEAALVLAEQLHPDVVLLDLGLPGIDGFEVARRMAPGPAIVLVSSRDARDIGPLAESVKGFIAKGELTGDALRAVLRTQLWLVGTASLALGVLVVVANATSHHGELRGLHTALGTLIGVAFIVTGLYAWSRRPDNRVGKLMVATGLAWGLSGLSQANAPLLFSIGLAFGPLYIVFVTWLVLVFPDGRLDSRLAKRLLVVGFIDVLVFYELGILLDIDTSHIGTHVPDNLFAIAHAPSVAVAFDTASAAIGAVIIAAVVVIAVRRRREATPLVRHAGAPVLWTGLVCLTAVSISLAIGSSGVSDLAQGTVGAVALLTFLALPFAYLVGLLRTRYARAGAVSDILGALSDRTALRDALAEALGDPALRLAYASAGRWLDREGHPVELPERGVTLVEREGECIGAIVHDPALDEDRDLVQAVAAAAALALENERLEAELRARVVELQESRSKLIEVSMAERRSLERDLHDGAQQRLVALSVQVGLAKRKLHDDPAAAEELLDRAGQELGLALEELRELARGIHPAILTDRGLPSALQALIDRAPLEVELAHAPAERLPPPVEVAAYFVVAESLTNIAKYAHAEHASVSVQRQNGHAIVEVRDDGVGGADPQAGTGLRGLAERLTIVDGRLEVVSPHGHGTIVRAEIPCA